MTCVELLHSRFNTSHSCQCTEKYYLPWSRLCAESLTVSHADCMLHKSGSWMEFVPHFITYYSGTAVDTAQLRCASSVAHGTFVTGHSDCCRKRLTSLPGLPGNFSEIGPCASHNCPPLGKLGS